MPTKRAASRIYLLLLIKYDENAIAFIKSVLYNPPVKRIIKASKEILLWRIFPYLT